MSISRIPPASIRRWTGPYLGEYYGSLYKTYNVDLDKKEGVVSLARRMQRIEDSSEFATHLSGTNMVRAFTRCNADSTDRYWALTDTGLLKTDSTQPEFNTAPTADWDTDGLDSSPTAPLDFTVHGNDSRSDSGNNKLFVTTRAGDISALNDTGDGEWTGSWWVTKQSQTKMDTLAPHPIAYFPFRKLSAVGDGNFVHTIVRQSDTQNDTFVRKRLQFPPEYTVRHILPTSDRLWFLLDNNFKGYGGLGEWDGYSESYLKIHNVYAPSAITGVNYREVPIILNSRGQWLEYTGQGLSPMVRNGQKIAFPASEEPGNTYLVGSDSFISPRVVPRGATVGADGLIYVNKRSPEIESSRDAGGIWCLNPEVGRLYNKYSIGQWGDSVDYGVQKVAQAGALYATHSDTDGRDLLAGGTILSSDTATQGGIWLVEEPGDTVMTKGYFTTQLLPAETIEEHWDQVWARYKRFISSSDELVIKAKGDRSLTLAAGLPLVAKITWASTTTFTVTLASADDELQVGDEVEVIAGVNSGWLAHITGISGSHGGAQTITIDETVTTGSGTAQALFDRWRKIKRVSDTTSRHTMANIGINSPSIQFKVELRGLEREVEASDLTVTSKPSVQIQSR